MVKTWIAVVMFSVPMVGWLLTLWALVKMNRRRRYFANSWGQAMDRENGRRNWKSEASTGFRGPHFSPFSLPPITIPEDEE